MQIIKVTRRLTHDVPVKTKLIFARMWDFSIFVRSEAIKRKSQISTRKIIGKKIIEREALKGLHQDRIPR